MDQWPGCEVERRRVLRYLQEKKVSNPVVLSGDIHTNWANDLSPAPDQEGNPVATEFVGTSISSGGDGPQAPKDLDKLLADNPMVKFHNTERGYLTCTVDAKEWRTDFRTLPYVTRPGAPVNTRATMVVESGRAGAKKA
jgi:alkaline phosphatase D